jgi:hypothetical protein
MNPTLKKLLGELALVNQQVTWVALDMLNDKLSADAQIAFGDRLVRLGEGFLTYARTEHVAVVDSEQEATDTGG